MSTLQALASLADTVAVPIEGALCNPCNVAGLERLSLAHPHEVNNRCVLNGTLRAVILVAED
jgi:hypothetical protein